MCKHAAKILFAAILLSAQSLQAQSVADSLLQKINTSKGVDRAEAYYTLVYHFLRKDPAAARQHIQNFETSIGSDRETDLVAYKFLFLGIYYSAIGKQDSAALNLEQAKEGGLLLSNNSLLVKSESSLGKTYIAMGNPERGLENLFAALKVLEAHPDLETELKVRSNIMWAYLELKRHRDCIQFGRATLLLFTARFDWMLPYYYNNLAISYGATERLDSARYFIDKSILIGEKVGDYNVLANSLFILGNIYMEKGQYREAIMQFEKAKPYREKIGNVFFMVADQYTLSDLYAKAGDYKRGVAAGLEGLRLAEQNNLLLKFEGVYEALAMNYEGLGDFKSASKYHKLWAITKDSIYKNATTEAIAEMQTKYESEKKQQQIALQNLQLAERDAQLQNTYLIIIALIVITILLAVIFLLARNRFRKKQELLKKENEIIVREAFIQATLQSQEMERKRFAQDLHDSMGQLISALRLVLSNTSKDAPLEQRVEMVAKSGQILDEMYKEIRSVAFNLMPQTLIQQGLLPALDEMALRINQSKKIELSVRGFSLSDRFVELQEISLYRVLQEWTNNVMKYSDATRLTIQLIQHDVELIVTVEDNGKGFDPAKLEKSQGNGWKNIQSRLKSIKATAEVDTQPGRSGTTFMIYMPLYAVMAPAETKSQG